MDFVYMEQVYMKEGNLVAKNAKKMEYVKEDMLEITHKKYI